MSRRSFTVANLFRENSLADPLKLELLDKINDALKTYESRRATILQKAMDEGGMDLVTQIEDQYRFLNDAYYEVFRSALAPNGVQYQQLMNEAIEVTKGIKEKISNLQGTIDLINNIAETINLVGRILILFGL